MEYLEYMDDKLKTFSELLNTLCESMDVNIPGTMEVTFRTLP